MEYPRTNCYQESSIKREVGLHDSTLHQPNYRNYRNYSGGILRLSCCGRQTLSWTLVARASFGYFGYFGYSGYYGYFATSNRLSPQDKLIKERVPPKIFCSGKLSPRIFFAPKIPSTSCSFTSTISMLSTALHHKPDPSCEDIK